MSTAFSQQVNFCYSLKNTASTSPFLPPTKIFPHHPHPPLPPPSSPSSSVTRDPPLAHTSTRSCSQSRVPTQTHSRKNQKRSAVPTTSSTRYATRPPVHLSSAARGAT